jgi:hypothetical protein
VVGLEVPVVLEVLSVHFVSSPKVTKVISGLRPISRVASGPVSLRLWISEATSVSRMTGCTSAQAMSRWRTDYTWPRSAERSIRPPKACAVPLRIWRDARIHRRSSFAEKARGALARLRGATSVVPRCVSAGATVRST